MTQITFIGGGNMATSIIGGLIRTGEVTASAIHVSDPSAEQRQKLTQDFGVSCHEDNLAAIGNNEVVILAVKPQMMKQVLVPLKEHLHHHQPLLISIAAGINIESLQAWGGCQQIVRCMPNTPALVGQGATGLYASEQVSIDQRNQADSLLSSTGMTVWVKQETDIDVVTAISGSGPAYYFLMMESMISAAKQLGIDEDTATKLTLQTAAGASQMAQQADVSPAELRQRVTSPGGTTEKALNIFESAHVRDIVKVAMEAAQLRAAELSRELGHD